MNQAQKNIPHSQSPWSVDGFDAKSVVYCQEHSICEVGEYYEVDQIDAAVENSTRNADLAIISHSPILYQYALKQAQQGCIEATSLIEKLHSAYQASL